MFKPSTPANTIAGLHELLQHIGMENDQPTIRVGVEFCEEQGSTSIDDLLLYGDVEGFYHAILHVEGRAPLKRVPQNKFEAELKRKFGDSIPNITLSVK